PLLLYAAYFLGNVPVLMVSVLLSVLSIASTIYGSGPFSIGVLNERLVHLQLFLISTAITSLILVGFSETKRMKLPALVLGVCWLLSGTLFYSFETSEKSKSENRFESLTIELQADILRRIEVYEDTLRGGVGLYSASKSVEPPEWRAYYNALKLTENYPGISGLGVIWPVQSHNLHLFESLMRKQGQRNFKAKSVPGFPLKPAGQTHYLIKFIEPLESNLPAVGLDISTEPHRKAAADLARDSGKSAITSKISLVQDQFGNSGFLMFLPIYRPNWPLSSVEERRKAHQGWLFGAFNAERFFNQILEKYRGEVQLYVFDGNDIQQDLLFATGPRDKNSDFELISTVELGQRRLTLGWKRAPDFVTSHNLIIAWVGLCGALVSLLLANLVASLQVLNTRSREMADELTLELRQSQEKLKESERRLVYALEGSSDGIWDWDLVKGEIYVSEKLANLLGGSQIGKFSSSEDMIDIIHPDDIEKTKESIQKHLTGQTAVHEVEARIRTVNGDWKWILTRGRISERLTSGEPARMTGVHINIDDLVKARESLEVVRRQLENVANCVPVIISQWTTDLKFIFGNRTFFSWFGLTTETARERRLSDLMPSEVYETHRKYIQEALNGKMQVFELSSKSHSDGEERQLVITYLPDFKEGTVHGIFVFAQDVTKLKETEQELRELSRLQTEEIQDLKRALDQSSIVAFTDGAGNITYANDKFCEISKYSREELLGQNHRILNSGFHPKDFFAGLWRTISSGRVWSGEIKNRAKDGNSYWVFTTIVPLLEKNGMSYQYVAIQTDITEHKKLEEERTELEANTRAAVETTRLKSEFLATMSHEIRTPINGIIGMTDLLMDTPLEAKQMEYANIVSRSAESLLAIVNDILDFSKVEAGRMDLEIIDFNFHLLLGEVHSAFLAQAEQKGIHLAIESNLPPSTYFKGDPGRIRQVLINLVGNAIKFTPSGEVRVRASVDQGTERTAEIKIEVIDTGIGIEPGALQRMFQPFTQADATTQRKFGGTGLGLSISKRLVELMGGLIGVASEPGKGSNFWFQLNLELGESKAPDSVNLEVKNPAHHSSARILIAEDNPVNQQVALEMLAKLGYRSQAVANGNEVLQALRQIPYDLILMDCQMPEMDGYQTSREIRKMNDVKISTIPIIALTANVMKEDREKCLAAGMDDYISKPIKMALLAKTLRKWLTALDSIQEPEKTSKKEWKTSAIDPNTLDQIRSLQRPGKPDVLQNLIRLFLESAEESMAAIRSAARARNLEILRETAHSLKSSCANLGAHTMSEICLALEQVDDHLADAMEQNLAALESEFQKVKAELESYRDAA
ncbi:MAG: CHASE domain-containing protein, partial [Bdellovibrionales bacterium]